MHFGQVPLEYVRTSGAVVALGAGKPLLPGVFAQVPLHILPPVPPTGHVRAVWTAGATAIRQD